MIVVVSDTSVISNLAQVGLLSILKELYTEILIPEKVKEELEADKGAQYNLSQSTWIKTVTLNDVSLYAELLTYLDAGEAQAIALAKELGAGLLMIDERKGREIAKDHGLIIVGLLGLLLEAKSEAIINEVKPILDKLIYEVGFRISPKLYRFVLKNAEEL